MKRTGLMLVIMAVMVVLSAGVAVAAVKFGTEGRDIIKGTNAPDVIFGEGGVDTLAGRKDDDTIHGGEGRDDLYGGSFLFGEIFEDRRLVQDGNDKLFGGDGPDCVFGGTGDDVLYGGNGSDLIGFFCFEFIIDTGNDTMLGGDGADEIISIDRKRDIVVCGSGRDVVYANRLDRIAGDCERVFYPR
ncbi:MAG: hypothetical protein H0U16_02375 [Actinobacteria bacterium]|nr:hypothetical protein [Actinomycetota bacterium]